MGDALLDAQKVNELNQPFIFSWIRRSALSRCMQRYTAHSVTTMLPGRPSTTYASLSSEIRQQYVSSFEVEGAF